MINAWWYFGFSIFEVKSNILFNKILNGFFTLYSFFLIRNKEQIKEELNIKSIEIADNINNMLDYNIKPNFALLSPKYGKDMQSIVGYLKSQNQNELVSVIKKDKKIEFNIDENNFEILESELIIEELPKNDLCINSNRDYTVGLDTIITNDLKTEGIARDLVRHVQNFRKDSGFEVSNRIIFAIEGPNEIIDAVNSHADYFKNETLTESITHNFDSIDFNLEIKINNCNIKIGISKLDKK